MIHRTRFWTGIGLGIVGAAELGLFGYQAFDNHFPLSDTPKVEQQNPDDFAEDLSDGLGSALGLGALIVGTTIAVNSVEDSDRSYR